MANRTIIRLFRPLLLLTCYYCRQQQSTSHISTLHISCLMYSNDLHFNCTVLIYCACLCLRLRGLLGFVGDMSLRSEHFDLWCSFRMIWYRSVVYFNLQQNTEQMAQSHFSLPFSTQTVFFSPTTNYDFIAIHQRKRRHHDTLLLIYYHF